MSLAEILYPHPQVPRRCFLQSRVCSYASKQPNQQAHVSAGMAAKCVIMFSHKYLSLWKKQDTFGMLQRVCQITFVSVAELMD